MEEHIKAVRQSGLVMIVLLVFSVSIFTEIQTTLRRASFVYSIAIGNWLTEEDSTAANIDYLSINDNGKAVQSKISQLLNDRSADSYVRQKLAQFIRQADQNRTFFDAIASSQSIEFTLTVSGLPIDMLATLSPVTLVDGRLIMVLATDYGQDDSVSFIELSNPPSPLVSLSDDIDYQQRKRNLSTFLNQLKQGEKQILMFSPYDHFDGDDFKDKPFMRAQASLQNIDLEHAGDAFVKLYKDITLENRSVPLLDLGANPLISLFAALLISMALQAHICSQLRVICHHYSPQKSMAWLLNSWAMAFQGSKFEYVQRIIEGVFGLLGYSIVALTPLIIIAVAGYYTLHFETPGIYWLLFPVTLISLFQSLFALSLIQAIARKPFVTIP